VRALKEGKVIAATLLMTLLRRDARVQRRGGVIARTP